MSLLQFVRVDYSVGGPLLLENVDLSIEANERICVVGRNGEGKSTLLRLIAGEMKPDDGEIRVEKGTRGKRCRASISTWSGMIQMLDLIHPVYQQTASYGHFGRTPQTVKVENGKTYTTFSLEKTDEADALRADAKLK